MDSKPKIALIEDEPEIQRMYSTKLTQEGFDVQVAGDGDAGWVLLSEFKPDIVLLDMMMPNVGGIEFLEQARSVAANDALKIIVLTNLDDPQLRESVKPMVNGYLVKAEVTPEQLVEFIKSL